MKTRHPAPADPGPVREFLAGSRPLDLQPQTRAEAYAFVAETLQRFDYSPPRPKHWLSGSPAG